MTQPAARRVARAVARRVPPQVGQALRKAAAIHRVRTSVRAACGLPEATPLMVYAGRIADDRGIGAVVDALPRLPKFHLAVVCPPADRSAVQALLARAGAAGVADRVHAVSRSRPLDPAFLGTADLAVLGFERTDGDAPLVPAALDAYRAAGLTIVAGNARAVREYLSLHNAGEVFAPGSPRSFVNAVQRAQQREPTEPTVLPLDRPGPDEPRPEWNQLGSGPVRLGLGTANYAGQLSAFARAICVARPDVSVELVTAKPPASFRHPADVYLHFPAEHRLDVQLEQIRRVLGGYSHLIVDAFRPVLGRLNGDDISADLPALNRAKIKVALLAHGSEIRHPARHQERHPDSPFRQAPEELLGRLTAVTEKNRRTAQESGLPVFVTTSDLLADVPWATWAPLVIDVDAWACNRPVLERSRPIVLHAPSTRWTKGTDQILPELQDLHDREIIDFRLIEGVPYSEMRRLVQEADIVVDQLVMGDYGTFACEGMAAGRVVIAYVSDDAMAAADIRPPIVRATPSSLVKAIESVLEDRAAGARSAAEGVAYVREYHDGRRTALAFDDFLR